MDEEGAQSDSLDVPSQSILSRRRRSRPHQQPPGRSASPGPATPRLRRRRRAYEHPVSPAARSLGPPPQGYLDALALPKVPYDGVDRISALPDDLLLQVLERLGFVRAAARTCIFSRRWRSLWTHLPEVTIALHDVPFDSLKEKLRCDAVGRGARHYLLDIRVPGQDDKVYPTPLTSLLDAAAALLPLELRFTLPRDLRVSCFEVILPCFRRATSIELHGRDLRLSPRYCCFDSLERLSLSGCHIDLATFIPRLRRLRRLSLSAIDLVGMDNITICSASLEELVVQHKSRWTCLSRISVKAPVLKQLTMSFHVRRDVGMSILAPMMENVSWSCLYTNFIYGFGLWGISEVGLKTTERHEQTDSQLPSINVLSLHMCAQDAFSFPNAELRFGTEIDKHMVTNFSTLALHLRTKGHVFGAIVLHLLGLHRIRTAIRNLKIILLGSEVKDSCPVNCPCDEPKDHRSQSISLANLEKVEIEGVEGEDHEFYFLEAIFRCAPMLRRVTLRCSDQATPSDDWCRKINNIVVAYPAVECTIDSVRG